MKSGGLQVQAGETHQNMRISLSLLLSCLFLHPSHTQSNLDQYEILATPTQASIQIDGELEEAAWQQAKVATDFQLNQPVDDQPASKKTEVRLLYDDKFLYVAATCWDDADYVIQTLKRDQFDGSDAFAVLIDPVRQQTNGFGFGINAYGAQTEVLITPDDADDSWDNAWFGATQRYVDHWTVEMAIPFRTLRFKDEQDTWGINFSRIDPGTNETHTWAPVPRQFDFIDLGYYGTLRWENPPNRTGSNISFIPYVTTALENDRGGTNGTVDIGGDAKIAITPTLNLDLTVNPDFSQVEVDRQVTNLNRFNIFFPERRRFFLENADVFNSFGQFADRPFYSRQIGLDAAGQTIPILYGARLSGNLNANWRVGMFNMHTRGDDNRHGQNYTALGFQRRLWARSEIKGIFLNRQAYDGGESIKGDYGRNLGGEFVYSTPDGKVRTNVGYLHSMKEGFSTKNQHIYGRFDYSGTRFRTFLSLQHMGENYFADIGFTGRLLNFDPVNNEVVRVGFTQVGSFLDYYTYPKDSKKVNYHWSGLENFVYVNPNGTLNEWYTRLRHFIFYKNTSQLRFRINNNYVDLLFPFALTETPLPATAYNMTEFNVQFNTDTRKALNTEAFIVYGQFYNGTKLTYRGSINFRKQPWGNFSLGIEQNDIWLPDPYGKLHLTLATARAEINFSTNLFWTTFLQYNTQRNNFNINSRLQWRFAPMSDVFLVYTDNYTVSGIFGPKNRTLVAKVNYWLGL